jgi:chromosome partitioning protein
MGIFGCYSLRGWHMARIFAVVNQKGGVGKTTTTVNLSSALAKLGYNVLLIDSDAQAHAGKSIGFELQDHDTLYDLYTGKQTIENVIYNTGYPNLWLLPSDVTLSTTEVELSSRVGKEYLLTKALKSVQDEYDFIFIDCPPFLGILTINALIASTDVLITSTMSYLSLEGVSDLLDLIEVINESLNLDHKVKVEGVLACMYDSRTKMSRKVRKELERYFDDKVYDVTIPVNVALNEAQTRGVPAIYDDPGASGARAYMRLAKELLRKSLGVNYGEN